MMAEAAFLLKTGWTYDEYLETPDELLDHMMLIINTQAEVAENG